MSTRWMSRLTAVALLSVIFALLLPMPLAGLLLTIAALSIGGVTVACCE